MNNFEIKYLIADEYINSVIREKKFDIDLISKKLKIDSSIIKTLFPYSEEINKLEYLKLFNSKIDDEILIFLNKEIRDEDATYFEKILEAFFIKFENLDKYKKALIFLSSKKRDKLLNFLILNNQNHKFILKLMKCCGDKDPFIKLNIKAALLNSLYIKNLNELLNREEITIDKIMSKIDKDLKKVFELPFLFKN